MDYWIGKTAVIGTMHGKETVIGPRLEALGLAWHVPTNFDTDQFGTFTGEIARAGTQLEAARKKARAAMAATGAKIGVASEGTFGPHPAIPFLQVGHELVVLLDDEGGLEIIGSSTTTTPGVGRVAVQSATEALEHAAAWGFPTQGVIVRGSELGGPLIKNCASEAELATAVTDLLHTTREHRVWIETDMRAHRHRSRMEEIAKATDALIARCESYCPACATPGFGLTRTIPGLPCVGCGGPSDQVRNEVWECARCHHQEERPRADERTFIDPGECGWCNP
jgi:hypothetical protein